MQETYPEPCHTSNMERLVKICSILHVWQGSEYPSERKDPPPASLQRISLGKTSFEISKNFKAFIFHISSGRFYEKHALVQRLSNLNVQWLKTGSSNSHYLKLASPWNFRKCSAKWWYNCSFTKKTLHHREDDF